MCDPPNEELNNIVTRIRESKGLIKDASYHLKKYPNIIIGKWRIIAKMTINLGSELVTWFVENQLANNREEAVKLGERLVEADLLHHVHDDHHFKDGLDTRDFIH